MADDALFGPDGTQDPPPPPAFPDPLAGLVTGAAMVGEAAWARLPVAEPTKPPEVDSSMREAINAALAEPRRRGRQVGGQPRPGTPPVRRPSAQPAQGTPQRRPANAVAGWLIAGLILLATILATAGRAIIDALSHAFH
ncbi:hypothetical protein [Gandjariella thermophila]|uniref:hypothetical protein n=1 Tax=Gandjariella thermophila TaxID=1931992 RepID=UPI0010F9000C|nr:hypothetical protein [Gandjariella thermophila]